MAEEDRRDAILNTLGINEVIPIGTGMEAFVYKYDEQRVLKIYGEGKTSLSKLRILKEFYETLETSMPDIQFPRIEEIIELDGTLITIETFVQGRNMKDLIEACTEKDAELLIRKHLAGLLKMREVNSQAAFKGIKLFPEEAVSPHSEWHLYLSELLRYKLSTVETYLQTHVRTYNEKIDHLFQALSLPYRGDYSLVHGDFCPENLLVNADLDVTGIIDFGLMTMRGDFLFDVATGWLFFDMYDQYPFDFRSRYYNLVIETFGEVKSSISLYVLLYSIYSVNAYADDFSDGHAAWCVKNLNDKNLWRQLGGAE